MPETTLKTCPADGCDYTSGLVNLRGHWGGSDDEKHTGSWREQMLNEYGITGYENQ